MCTGWTRDRSLRWPCHLPGHLSISDPSWLCLLLDRSPGSGYLIVSLLCRCCCVLPYRACSVGLIAPQHELNGCSCYISYMKCFECLFPADELTGFTHSSRFLPQRDTKGKRLCEPIHFSCPHLSWQHRFPFIIKHISHPPFCLKQGWNLHIGLTGDRLLA